MHGRLLEGSTSPVSKRSRLNLDRKQWKLLLWTAVAGLIFGLIGFGTIGENSLLALRNCLHWHKASGDVVLVKIDDESPQESRAVAVAAPIPRYADR